MSFNRFSLFSIGCAIASLAVAQTNVRTNPNATLDSQDRKFIDNAVKGGREEVDLGRLAADKASDPSVKQFGQRMIDDHSRADQQLEKIANDKGVTLPPSSQSSEYRALSKLSGPEFDRAYKTVMVRDHEKDVAEFERESNGAQDPDVRQFATNTMPTLRSHLDQARMMKP